MKKFDHRHFVIRPIVLAGLLAGAVLGAHAQQQQQGGAMQQNPAGTAALPDAAAAGEQAQQRQRHQADRAERRTERMQIRAAQHLAALKVRLQLTPAQQGAWDTFARGMQPTRDELDRMLQLRSQLRSLTTPERIDRMRALRAERDAAMDKRFDAVKTFYAQLSPEQQKTFDANAMRWGGGEGRHGRQHDGGGGRGMDMDRHHGGERAGG